MSQQTRKDYAPQENNPRSLSPLKMNGHSSPSSVEEDEGLLLFSIPYHLELYNLKLVVIQLDNFITSIAILPFKALLDALKMLFLDSRRKSQRIWLNLYHLLMMLAPLAFVSDYFTDHLFDLSYWYHGIRSQSTLKFYGIVMLLEVIDKMLYHFGEFLLVDQLWKKMHYSHLLAATIYNFCHALVLQLLLVVYNVLLNSELSLFVIMVFVNNSMKLKSTLFKKFSEQAYLHQTHVDLNSRTQKIVFFASMLLVSRKGFKADILTKLFIMFGSQMFTEWVQHVSLTKMNQLNTIVFRKMSAQLNNCIFLIHNQSIERKKQQREKTKLKDGLNDQATFGVPLLTQKEKEILCNEAVEPSFRIGFQIQFIVFPYCVLLLKFLVPIIAANSMENNLKLGASVFLFKFCNDYILHLLAKRSKHYKRSNTVK